MSWAIRSDVRWSVVRRRAERSNEIVCPVDACQAVKIGPAETLSPEVRHRSCDPFASLQFSKEDRVLCSERSSPSPLDEKLEPPVRRQTLCARLAAQVVQAGQEPWRAFGKTSTTPFARADRPIVPRLSYAKIHVSNASFMIRRRLALGAATSLERSGLCHKQTVTRSGRCHWPREASSWAQLASTLACDFDLLLDHSHEQDRWRFFG